MSERLTRRTERAEARLEEARSRLALIGDLHHESPREEGTGCDECGLDYWPCPTAQMANHLPAPGNGFCEKCGAEEETEVLDHLGGICTYCEAAGK